MPITSGRQLDEEIFMLDVLGTIMSASVDPLTAVRMMAANHSKCVLRLPFLAISQKMEANKNLSLGKAMATQAHAFSSFVPGVVAATECLKEPERGVLFAADVLRDFRSHQDKGIEEKDLLDVVDLNLLALLIEGDQQVPAAIEQVFIHSTSLTKPFWGHVSGRMKEGVALSTAMAGDEKTRLFQPWAVNLIRVGEENGLVNAMIAKIAKIMFDAVIGA